VAGRSRNRGDAARSSIASDEIAMSEQSRVDNRKLIDLATAVVDGHRLLPRDPQAPSQP
jgi:hypothetical protein